MKTKSKTHTVVAGDVTNGYVDFFFGDQVSQMKGAIVQVTLSDGTPKAWDGKSTITGGKLRVDNTGAVDFAATDLITVAVH